MARGKTLGDLLTSFRAECSLSTNPAHNVQVRDQQVKLLQRTQEWLWDDYSWPFLSVERYLVPQAGQRYYDPAGFVKLDGTAAGDVKPDRITALWLKDGDNWRPLDPGISTQQMNAYDSDANERAWPPQRWKVSEDEQVELWPIPDQNSVLADVIDIVKVVGVRNLATMTDDGHTADLDDRLITLFAASEHLNGKEAQDKRTLANRRLLKLQGGQTVRKRIRVFGKAAPRRVLRGPPTVYYRTT